MCPVALVERPVFIGNDETGISEEKDKGRDLWVKMICNWQCRPFPVGFSANHQHSGDAYDKSSVPARVHARRLVQAHNTRLVVSIVTREQGPSGSVPKPVTTKKG